nr:lipocalin-15-like [Anolis sagrei ordinatus]
MALLPLPLLLLLWAFAAQADVAIQPDFDLEKFAGSWHLMAGASDCPIFQKMKNLMTTSAAIIRPLPNGDMTFLTGYPLQEECKTIEMHFKKTEEPGRFVIDGKQEMRVMETDYSEVAYLYTFKEAEGEPSSTTVQVLTRNPELTPEILEKFKAYYHSVGLGDDMVAILPKSDLCFKALSG